VSYFAPRACARWRRHRSGCPGREVRPAFALPVSHEHKSERQSQRLQTSMKRGCGFLHHQVLKANAGRKRAHIPTLSAGAIGEQGRGVHNGRSRCAGRKVAAQIDKLIAGGGGFAGPLPGGGLRNRAFSTLSLVECLEEAGLDVVFIDSCMSLRM